MSNRSTSDFNISTQITQLGRDASKQAGFVNVPVYRGSTVIFPTVNDLEHNRAEFNYGTMGTPTIASWRARRVRCYRRLAWGRLRYRF